MDIQIKRGLLDVCVLAAIREEDSYGYWIIKKMNPYVPISESTLYPILRRLEAAELLTVYPVEHNGRIRKYYHITPAGRRRLKDFQEEWKEILAIYRFVTREDDEDDKDSQAGKAGFTEEAGEENREDRREGDAPHDEASISG